MELKGKGLSHGSKIIGTGIVMLTLALNAAGSLSGIGTVIPVDDAIKAAVFIAATFAPIDISIWLGILKKAAKANSSQDIET